jgi:hypothetical protein
VSEQIGNEEGAAQPSAEEIAVRVATMRSAVMTNLLCVAGVVAYAWASANELLSVVGTIVLGLLLVAAVLVRRLPLERMVGGQGRETRLVIWNGAVVIAIAAASALDGGGTSPICFFFVIPVLFTALTFPLRVTLIVGALAVLAFLALAVSSARTSPSCFGRASGCCAGSSTSTSPR